MKLLTKIENGMLDNTYTLCVGYNESCWSGLPSLTKEELKSVADKIYAFLSDKN